jgi:hypothetical protein
MFWPMALLVVVGVVSAPLLVRRVLRGQAVSPARWRSPGVELILLCWAAFIYEGADLMEFMNYAGTSSMGTWHAGAGVVLSGRGVMSLAALFVTVWTALCAAIGLGLKGSPEGAVSLRHGLKGATLQSLVLMCQAGLFYSLAALMEVIMLDGVPGGAEAVIHLVRRLEVFVGALLVVLVGGVFVAWTTPPRDARRGLWQIGAAAAALVVWGGALSHTVWTGLRWNAWRVVLDLPYGLPQRPPELPRSFGDDVSGVCARSGERWRCMGEDGVSYLDVERHSGPFPVAMPQDTPLAEVFVGSGDGLTLILCAGHPRTSTRGLERWFQPGIEDCSTIWLQAASPERRSTKDHVVIEASRDWTVQQVADEIVRARREGRYAVSVRWAEAPE